MFIFHRSRRQPVEIFDILVLEGGLPNAEGRFGAALRWGRREERFHEVGSAILIHDEMQTEYFLMAKEGLSEEELRLLDIELLQLIGEGQDVHTFGTGRSGEPSSTISCRRRCIPPDGGRRRRAWLNNTLMNAEATYISPTKVSRSCLYYSNDSRRPVSHPRITQR